MDLFYDDWAYEHHFNFNGQMDLFINRGIISRDLEHH